MTNYFLIYDVGHCGGGWMVYNFNRHPAQINVLGEAHKQGQLDFERRGLDKSSLDAELVQFLEDGEFYGDATRGVIKTFRDETVEWVKSREGRIIQLVRNPLGKLGTKLHDQLHGNYQLTKYAKAFSERYGRKPRKEQEWLEGVFLHTAYRLYWKAFERVGDYPLVRLEDINLSLAAGGVFFRRLMEWLTQVNWDPYFVEWIRENSPPDRTFRPLVEWSEFDAVAGRKRVERVHSQPIGIEATRGRSWNVDADSMHYWFEWDDETFELYHRYFAKIAKKLGYNQSHPGSVEPEWRFRNRYPWGEPERKRVWKCRK